MRILNVGDLTRKYKYNHYVISPGDSRQYQGIAISLRCGVKVFAH